MLVVKSAIIYPNGLPFYFVISSALTDPSEETQTSLCVERLQVAHNLYLWAFSPFVLKKRVGTETEQGCIKKKSAVTIFAMLAPCSEVTTQSLFVLVSSINDTTAGTKLLEMLSLIAQYSSQLLQSY